jgi:cell division protein DivIC
MKKYLVYFKNKFILATTIFAIYALFLDDNDIFSMISHARKLNRLQASKELVSEKLSSIRHTLHQLKYSSELERYAREQKFFKKDNEDIFVITNE